MAENLNIRAPQEVNTEKLPHYFHKHGGVCQFEKKPVTFALSYTSNNDEHIREINHINCFLNNYTLIAKTKTGMSVVACKNTGVTYLYAPVEDECDSSSEFEAKKFKILFTDWHNGNKYSLVKVAVSIESFKNKFLFKKTFNRAGRTSYIVGKSGGQEIIIAEITRSI